MRSQMERLVQLRKGWIVLCLLICFAILFTTSASAMASANFRMDWFVPLSGGGGTASSTHFALNYTVGQTAIGNSSSANYSSGLGFWTAIWNWVINLPLILK